MRRYILIFVLAFVALAATAQEKTRNYSHLSFVLDNGYVMPNTEFAAGNNKTGRPITTYQAYSLRMLWQNPGYTHWQQVFNAPYYGFGLTLNNFFNPTELGTPVSIYGVLGLPIARFERLTLNSEFQFGMAFGWKHYSPENPYNHALGGPRTVHVTGGLDATYHINDKLDIGLGASFVHFSNGGMERPNRGVNILSTQVKMNYHFGGRSEVKKFEVESPRQKKRSLLLMMSHGNHQLVEHEFSDNYFAVAGLSAIYLEQLSQAFRLGAGVDFGYWFGLNANPDGTIAPRDWTNLTVGYILQPEIIIDKLTLVGGIGIYARHRNYGNYKQLYQRLGVRYDIYKNYSIGVNVRAINFMLAEFMEFNLGYRFDWKK